MHNCEDGACRSCSTMAASKISSVVATKLTCRAEKSSPSLSNHRSQSRGPGPGPGRDAAAEVTSATKVEAVRTGE